MKHDLKPAWLHCLLCKLSLAEDHTVTWHEQIVPEQRVLRYGVVLEFRSFCLKLNSGEGVPCILVWSDDSQISSITFNERCFSSFWCFLLSPVHCRHWNFFTWWPWSWIIVRLKRCCCISFIFIIIIIITVIVFEKRISISKIIHLKFVCWLILRFRLFFCCYSPRLNVKCQLRLIRIILWLFWKITLLKMAILYDFEAALMFPPGLSRLPERKDICSSMMPKRNHMQGLYYLWRRNFVDWLMTA